MYEKTETAGRIDDVKVSDRCLTADEVRKEYKTDAECVLLHAKLDELRAELQARMAWRLTKSLDERTRERDEARRAARQLYDLWPAEFFATLGGIVESFPWIDGDGQTECVRDRGADAANVKPSTRVRSVPSA